MKLPLLLSLLVLTTGNALAMTRFYVSPQGSDQYTGRSPELRGKSLNGPFATLEHARDAIRQQRQAGKVKGAVTLYLRGGNYSLNRSLELTEQDGVSAAPLIVCAYPGETPRLLGGQSLSLWKPVIDSDVLARLTENARAHVQQADLKAMGITDYGQMSRRGFVGSSALPPMEVFFDGRPMTLARWPNTTWAKITAVPDGQTGGRFGYEGDQPKRWKDLSDVWVYGYWTYDWADSYQKVAGLDTEKNLVQTEAPHGIYGYTSGKRFFFLNVLEELDSPGEYYVDRKAGILYFWPPETAGKNETPVVSLLTGPLIALRNASRITLQGLTLECGRGNGVEITGGDHNLIAGCVLRNMGQYGVVIRGAKQSGVQSCDIYQTGDGGISLDGGDRKTLAAGELFAINNHIHHVARLQRTYNPAVSLSGVGSRVAHNRIHDLPHAAIQGGGNDHLIEYNELYRVCQETGDAGAFYMGRDFTQRGNVVRYNYFHDLRAGALEGQGGFTDVMGVYLDDCFSGVTVFGNLFVRAGRSAMIGGGRDNTIENNIFVDGTPAVHVDSRGKGWANTWFNGKDPYLMDGLKAMSFDKPPYSVRYPVLANILNDDPALAKGNRILRNISVGGTWLEMLDNLTDKIVEFKDNYVGKDPGFADAARGDYRIRADSPVWKLGFKPLPYAKMGLQKDAYRTTLPPKL